MQNLRKPYQMYVLNLDSGRIFWLTTILLLLLALSFFAGLLIGKEKSKTEVSLITERNKKIANELLNQVENKTKEDTTEEEEDYSFYNLMNPQSKNRISEDRIPIPDEPEKRVQTEEPIKTEPKNPYIELGDNQISSTRPYTIQVASYKKYENAKILKDYLDSEQYPAYIIKSNINGNIYYRVRVGPFASKALSLKVLQQLLLKKSCEGSFLTTK